MAILDNNILRFSFRQKWDGTDEQVNVMHWRVNENGTESDFNIIDGIIQTVTACYVSIEAHIANNVQPTVVDVYNVTLDAPLGQFAWTGGYSGGTGSGEALPTTNAALILFNTDTKRLQGKIYLPTFLEAAQADSRWTNTVLTAMTNFADGLVSGWSGGLGGEAEYVVWSRTRGIGRAPTSYRNVQIVATMRSRRLGRGS